MQNEQPTHIRLLLVDDEADFRAALARRLDKRGLAVSQAQSGPAGLDVLDSQEVDVVVLDMKMPGMNGLEVLRRIKADHDRIEVILLTGHSDTRDGIDGIKAGAFDYLTKPIAFEHLLEKIKQAREKQQREEERRCEAAYKEQIRQQMIATERLAALGTLAAGVAHEINNPLAIINEAAGYLEVLLEKPELAGMPRHQDFKKAVEKIGTAVARARAITHQLLGSVAKQPDVLAQVDLEALARETMGLIEKQAADHQVTLALQAAPDLETVWIDPNPVRQILINLLTNALHASSPEGRITLAIGQDKDAFALAVSDTGKGIPKENLEKIFEPFFSDKPPGQGTGLGLFVTRELADNLGATIDVSSRVGQGTTMTVTIPRREPGHGG